MRTMRERVEGYWMRHFHVRIGLLDLSWEPEMLPRTEHLFHLPFRRPREPRRGQHMRRRRCESKARDPGQREVELVLYDVHSERCVRDRRRGRGVRDDRPWAPRGHEPASRAADVRATRGLFRDLAC